MVLDSFGQHNSLKTEFMLEIPPLFSLSSSRAVSLVEGLRTKRDYPFLRLQRSSAEENTPFRISVIFYNDDFPLKNIAKSASGTDVNLPSAKRFTSDKLRLQILHKVHWGKVEQLFPRRYRFPQKICFPQYNSGASDKTLTNFLLTNEHGISLGYLNALRPGCLQALKRFLGEAKARQAFYDIWVLYIWAAA